MTTNSKLITLVLLCTGFVGFAQIQDFGYKMSIQEPSKQWHNIEVPNEVFNHISPDFRDVRIYGITNNNDTIEVPYLVRNYTDEQIRKAIEFNSINSSSTKEGKFVTFEVPNKEPLNAIRVNVPNKPDFDWKVRIEGSQDNVKWFTIVDDYRILSTQQDVGIVQYTTVKFSDSKYQYYRLLIKNEPDAGNVTAQVNFNELKEGKYRDYQFKDEHIVIDRKKEKTTEVDIDLGMRVPVNRLKFEVISELDYYRTVIIKYVTDSTKTTNGWKYRYQVATRSVLSSMEPLQVDFSTITSNKIKVVVENKSNKPLVLSKISVLGPEYDLIARFDEPATYYLVYGNKSARSPQYDIKVFEKTIPNTLTSLKLGDETEIEKAPIIVTEPLFKNKWWLWSIMIVIIGVLGMFTMKMMKQE